MSVEKIQGFLSAIENLNNGCNHSCDYSFIPLETFDSLQGSLDRYFSSYCLIGSPSQSIESWHLTVHDLGSQWHAELHQALIRWFFVQEFSPKASGIVPDNCVNQIIGYLNTAFKKIRVYEVKVEPPMFYELFWQDFAVETDKGNYLLHLGFTD